MKNSQAGHFKPTATSFYDMKMIPGPIVPKEKRNPKLPDEFEQLEYLSFDKEPMEYSELIFPNTEEAISRIKEIHSVIENVGFRYINPVPHNISVVVPSSELSKLSASEQHQAHKYVDNSISISIAPPQLIRYLTDEKYVDSLFKTGEIMLSSFNRCKNLSDNDRKDELEGKASVQISSESTKMVIGSGIGGNPLLLCSSCFQSSPKELDADEKSSAGFFISDPTLLISKIINGLHKKGINVKQALFGPCHYSDRIIERFDENLPNFISTENNTIDFENLFEYQNKMCGTDIYFEKETKFLKEKEWRFVFIIEEQCEMDSVIINIDHPEECCRRYKKV